MKEKESEKDVVLKSYNLQKIDKEDKDKYMMELSKLKDIYIPHICSIDEISEENNIMILKMDKYHTSVDNIKPINYFRENGIEHILRAIQECVKVFHSNGLIFGNLKPSNILINDDSTVVLSDYFSNILTKNCKNRDNDLIYMSPEMLKSEELSEKSDIYSIGCIIYYLLSGKSVFEGETSNEIKLKILNGEYRELYCRNQVIFNPLIQKMLKKKPEDRISIVELKEEFDGMIIMFYFFFNRNSIHYFSSS